MSIQERKNQLFGMGPKHTINRITLLIIASAVITLIILYRLFSLQVLQHNYYQELASKEQYGYVELTAQRGEIIIKDYHSGEEFPLATNITLNLLFADPVLIKKPDIVAELLSPILFDLEEEREIDRVRIEEAAKKILPETTEEDKLKLLKPLTDEELKSAFKIRLAQELGEKQRREILLIENVSTDLAQQIMARPFTGIEIKDGKLYAYPVLIPNQKTAAEYLAPLIKIPETKLEKILIGENRYVVLKKKLSPDISDKIKLLQENDEEGLLSGIQMREEYYRYYPEDGLGSNVIGYVNKSNSGQYGIENTYNTQLSGTPGKFQTKKDSIGRQITVGDSILEPAVDGDNIVLTIDRAVQLKVEQILKRDTDRFQADNGQILVMDPNTGRIIAMANYPSFNPNSYGDVYNKVEINLSPEEVSNLVSTEEAKKYYFVKNEETHEKYLVFEEKDSNGINHYYRYENFVGPEAYLNKVVSWPYEPGSVFKTLVMAAAIDDGDITPKTKFDDVGPIEVDYNIYTKKYDFEIKNSHGYFGLVDMNTVLAESLNTGMTFIAKKIGPALFYSYVEKFGILEKTGIELNEEATGQVDYFDNWTESELATHSFGQGLTSTLLQLGVAYSAIANGGLIVQPYLIDEIRHFDKSVTKTESQQLRRVISEDTAAQMTAMLIYSVENGVAKKSQLEKHFVAGKTGTSQTYKNGKALSGKGTTMVTYAGYGPVEKPQFVIIVRFEKPRTSEWGDSTAALTFKDTAQYLMDYYNVVPDKE